MRKSPAHQLTGFDGPCVHTLYVDKSMKGRNLMEAITRVNRVFKGKQGGLLVDYIGIGNELKAAMKEYTATKGRGTPTVDAHEAYSVLMEKLDVLQSMLHGCDCSDFLTGGHARAANHVLGLREEGGKDGKRRFADTTLALTQAFPLCCTLDEAKAVREEVAFMQAVKVILTKRDITAKKRTDEQRDEAIRQIISNAVVSGQVVGIFDVVGLDEPNIGLLDDRFLDWSERESARAKLRLMVKRVFRKYKYPPDLQEEAVDLVLRKAQVFGDNWGGT